MAMPVMAMLITETHNLIRKHFKCSKRDYKRIHQQIRRRLEKEAFNKVHSCHRCGSQENLEIHIPVCNPALINQPYFYEILCKTCHDKIPR
jgi:peptide subunit release factor 1 (eRF1)